MRTLPERRPSLKQIGVSFSRGVLLGGGCIFGLTIMVALAPCCLPIQRDYGFGILFDDLGGRMALGALAGGIASIAASYYAGRLSKPIRILSLSLLLTYALSLTCSPIRQQNLATQMMVAIDHKDIEAVKSVLNRGFDVNRIYWSLKRDAESTDHPRNYDYSAFHFEPETTLIHAVKCRDRAIVTLLLQRGADVNELNEEPDSLEYGPTRGRSALSAAARRGDLFMVKLLIDHGANVNACPDSWDFALYRAADAGHADVVKFLIQHGADVHAKTSDGTTPLSYAADSGNLEIGRLFLELGIDVDAKTAYGETALLHAASSQPNASFVSLLLDHGANISDTDIDQENALTLAAKANHLEVARLLHSKGLPLHVFEAASLNDAKTLDRLLHNGEKLEQEDSQNMTPLLNAVQANNVPAVRLLLSRGADIRAIASSKTVLMLINDSNSVDPTEMIDILVDNGSDINAVSLGESVLIKYVMSGNIKAVKALLKHHPDLTLWDCTHETALTKARNQGSQEIAYLLVKAGAQQ